MILGETMQTGFAIFAAFNLVCDVQGFGDDVHPALSAEVVTYRVDPMLGRWCSGACPAALPIAAMSDLEIVLSHRRWDGHSDGYAIRVTHPTGDYRETSFSVDESAASPVKVGRCERAPSSGFPPESLRSAIPLRVEVPASVDPVRPGAMPR